MDQKNKNKTEKQKKVIPKKDVDLKEIVERKKLQNKVLEKMIDSINNKNK